MLSCIFYSLFFILFINLSIGSLRLSQINRAFLSSYKGMYEASVVTVGRDGEPIYPYFDRPTLREYVHTFIEDRVSYYATNYSLVLDFYKEDGVTKCTTSEPSRCVKINLKADINFLFSYNKTQSFTIKDRTNI